MQNPTTFPLNNQPAFDAKTSIEVYEAVRTTLRASAFRLESEYHAFGDWESRLELAEELRETLDDLSDAQVDEVARVINTLEDESEEVSSWDERTDLSERIRRVAQSVEKEARTNA
jgi:hypothetical protein